MVEVVSIAPRLDEPGLIAYQCPACEHAISILQHQQERGPAPYRWMRDARFPSLSSGTK